MYAEEILGAALDLGIHGDLLEQLLSEFEATGWIRRNGRAYPDCYAFALGRYRAHPRAVDRMRRALRSVPRVDPDDYDILFNVEGGDPAHTGPTWDVVKWLRVPEMLGWLPGHGWSAVVLLDPFPVYCLPAPRSPLSLSDFDFNQMRRNATTLRSGGEGLNREMLENNLKRQADRQAERSEADLDFAEYYRTHFRRTAEELGI